jgi:hypothetical protein
MLTTIMAGFAFGYCVMDIIQNYRARKNIDAIVKDAIERETNYD